MWVPFLQPFPENEARFNFFLGVQNGVFWVGAKKFMLKKFMCFFGPLFPKLRCKEFLRCQRMEALFDPAEAEITDFNGNCRWNFQRSG